jgi:hypothetical protein
MSSFHRYFRRARPVLKALPMRFLPSLVASVAVASLLLTGTSAHAEDAPVIAVPAAPAVTAASVTAPARIALTATSASTLGSLMVVLDVLGLMDDHPKPAATTRTATWLQPEPPRTPLLYSSLVVAKF